MRLTEETLDRLVAPNVWSQPVTRCMAEKLDPEQVVTFEKLLRAMTHEMGGWHLEERRRSDPLVPCQRPPLLTS